jgi:hypothetical protein
MWDGRVGGRALGGHTSCRPSNLFATHIEGADTELWRHAGPTHSTDACATGRAVRRVEAPSPFGGGQLACVTQRRPMSSTAACQAAGRLYAHPYPWKGNAVLVSSRTAPGAESWGVWTFDADTQTGALLYDDPGFHELQARFVRPRPRPDGHSTVVNTTATTGTFYGLNCYTAGEPLKALGHAGEVKRIRLIEGVFPQAAGNSTPEAAGNAVRRRLVGEAPVEADGSFNVEVPASTPLLLQALDERGLALATCG